MRGQSDVRGTQGQKSSCVSCSSWQALHQLLLGSMFLTKLSALTHPLHWSPALRQVWNRNPQGRIHGKLAICVGKNLHKQSGSF